MTLVNRVSLFFLVALAGCLIGYSVLSYLLIRQHLYARFDQELRHALNVLVASVEVEPDGAKWQPLEHTIELGDEQATDEVRWLVLNDRGEVLGRSLNLETPAAGDALLLKLARTESREPEETVHESTWRLLRKRLTIPAAEAIEAPGVPEPENDQEPEADEFPAIAIIVARSTVDLQATLWSLAGLLAGLPVGLVLLAAVVGRAYCRRALEPLRAMSVQAQSVTEADFRMRLPVGPRRDELADLASAFNGLLDQLETAFERQRRFTGDAAHQLRTPLTVLRGEIEVTLRRPRDGDDYRRTLETLRRQTEELQQLVETLLFLARTQGDTALPGLAEIHLADWLRDYLARRQPGPRVTSILEPEARRAHVRAAGLLLEQALDNLLGNALKYSGPEGPVLIRVTAAAGSVLIAVEDQGSGVPPEEREAIFEPFYRTTSARRSGAEGTGLGLALVARLAEALGGQVRCEPNTPRGSRFVLRLNRAGEPPRSA